LGAPVIASDLAVFREVAGDIPQYLNPIDGIGWLNAVDEFAFSDAQRNQQLSRLQNWQAPSWHDHFQKFDALMHQVAPKNA
jgi:hypothetical protein